MNFNFDFLEVKPKPTLIQKIRGKIIKLLVPPCSYHPPTNEAKDDFECHYWVDAPYDEKLGYWDDSKAIMIECQECIHTFHQYCGARLNPKTNRKYPFLICLLLYGIPEDLKKEKNRRMIEEMDCKHKEVECGYLADNGVCLLSDGIDSCPYDRGDEGEESHD
jgi:hypothetical protein